MVFIIDIETNDLLSGMIDYTSFPYKLREDAKLWVVSIRNFKTKEVVELVKEQITKEAIKEALKGATHIVAHNGIKFDFLALKLFGVFDYHIGYIDQDDTLFGNKVTFVDTLIISRLFNPSRFGGHSLGKWGERLGEPKTDFRQICIDKGYIDKDSPKGTEFRAFCPEMVSYCTQDTITNDKLLSHLSVEKKEWAHWDEAIKMENKLADLGIKRENLGFAFDKDAAIACVEDLTEKMTFLEEKVNPILPPKKLNKTEENKYTPPKNQLSYTIIKDTTPPKDQIKKDGSLSSAMENFIEKHNIIFDNGVVIYDGKIFDFPLLNPLINNPIPSEAMFNFANSVGGELRGNIFIFEGKEYPLPMECKPLITSIPASIGDLDHVKEYLISLGWKPSEWRVRDLTKDSKKISLPYEKRVQALERWLKDTFKKGKYKEERLKELGMSTSDEIREAFYEKLKDDFPVRVPTSPSVRVGVSKELCPNLESLGAKVDFAKDFTLYLTYKHRKASIAGGDVEDMDFDKDSPNTGYLSIYREEDGRVPTSAIELSTNTGRYAHVKIANVPRITSEYGAEMRGLFGCGKDSLQLAYDFSSLEARIQGHFVTPYTGGVEMAKTLLAEKPFDIHTITSQKLGIDRNSGKSVNYMLTYGGNWTKVKTMLGVDDKRAKEIYNGFWDINISLKELKDKVEGYWESNGEKFIKSIDGRKIMTRSKHSLLNALFQSSGVICAKYTHVYCMQYLEEGGFCIDPFEGKPDVSSMIEYHDECQLFINKNFFKYRSFNTEDEAKTFVKEWVGVEQLSAISHGTKVFVALPNDVTKAIEKAMNTVNNKFKLKVPLGYEWMVGRNWAECH